MTPKALAWAGKAAYILWTGNRTGEKLFPKWAARRAAKKAKQRAEIAAAGGEFFQHDEDSQMDALKGAAKSKLIWLGVAQIAYSVFELWAQGTLTPQSAATAVSGGLTILFRAATTQSLADKVKS